jgi:hypothetical protein
VFATRPIGLTAICHFSVKQDVVELRKRSAFAPFGALGGSLWTGVVLALFVQVIPEIKRRQIKHAIDEYESARRDKARE